MSKASLNTSIFVVKLSSLSFAVYPLVIKHHPSMSALPEEEAIKMTEAIGHLSSAIAHLEQSHSNMLKQNAKVCWYIKTSKYRQEVLRRRIEEVTRSEFKN